MSKLVKYVQQDLLGFRFEKILLFLELAKFFRRVLLLQKILP
jgi:hypothetical protein